MATSEIGALRAALSASSMAFERDMGKARDAVRKSGKGMESSMDRVRKSFTNVIGKVTKLGVVAGAAAVGGFALFVKKQIDAADAMGKLGMSTGTSSEYLSAMAFVAGQAGTSLETVAKATQKLSKNMDDFGRGIGEARYAFEDLGLEVKNTDGSLRSAEDVILDVADRFSKMEDGTQKTTAAVRLFGRAGAELVPMLNMGRDGIQQLMDKAKEMGLVISTETAMQAAELNDQLDVMKNQLLGLGRTIALNFVPDLNEAVKTIRNAYEESGLLTAGWVALAAAGRIAFGRPIQKQIEDTEALLDELYKAQNRAARVVKIGDNIIVGRDAITHKIEQTKEKLAELRVLQEKDIADKEAFAQKAKEIAEAEAEQQRKATEAMRKQAEERAQLAEKAKEEETAEKKRVSTIESTVTALEAERDALTKTRAEIVMNRLEILGATAEQKEYAQTILGAIKAYEDTEEAKKKAKELAEEGKKGFEELQRTIEGWGRSSAETFADFAMAGKASFSDLINSMIRDMITMVAYQNVFGPLFGGISGMFGGGLLGSLFGGGKASGGPVSAGRIYEVAERGPEILQMGNRQFLMMGEQSGHIVAAQHKGTDGGSTGDVSVQVVVNTPPGEPMDAQVGNVVRDMDQHIINVHLHKLDRSRSYRQAHGRR